MTNPTTTTPATGKPPARVHVSWAGGKRFDAGRPGGPTARIDGSAETGQSPVDTLVSALAACTMVDVVEILEKRRTPPSAFTVEAVAQRADTIPRRLTHVDLEYRVDGTGIDRGNAERAIALALTRYCSVRDSLDPALPIEASLTLNGERGRPITLAVAPV
jgi:putative redox protein